MVTFILSFLTSGTVTTEPTTTTETTDGVYAEETMGGWALTNKGVSTPNGDLIAIPGEIPPWSYTILAVDHSHSLLFEGYETRSIWLVDATTGQMTRLTPEGEAVVDLTVAYDTVYWLNLAREVWASDWQSENTEAYLFCEDAIAVSPFTDECEGAVVSPERANWVGYGDLPIYSPYGVD